jgi:hypothetical protein
MGRFRDDRRLGSDAGGDRRGRERGGAADPSTSRAGLLGLAAMWLALALVTAAVAVVLIDLL